MECATRTDANNCSSGGTSVQSCLRKPVLCAFGRTVQCGEPRSESTVQSSDPDQSETSIPGSGQHSLVAAFQLRVAAVWGEAQYRPPRWFWRLLRLGGQHCIELRL